ALRVAEPDLDRCRHSRFEDHAVDAVGTEHARARDLDLLRAPARTDLAALRTLALLLLPHFEVIRVDDVVGHALCGEDTLVEPDRAMAEPRDGAEIVGHQDDRLLRRAELADLGEALVLEVLVADRKHLVDE